MPFENYSSIIPIYRTVLHQQGIAHSVDARFDDAAFGSANLKRDRKNSPAGRKGHENRSHERPLRRRDTMYILSDIYLNRPLTPPTGKEDGGFLPVPPSRGLRPSADGPRPCKKTLPFPGNLWYINSAYGLPVRHGPSFPTSGLREFCPVYEKTSGKGVTGM